MENKNIFVNNENGTSRSERRLLKRKIKNVISKALVIKANEAFNKIQPQLVRLGWLYEEQFVNIVHFSNKSTCTISPAVRLVNKVFSINIIPHDCGLEISRFEVFEEFQGQGFGGRFLDNILLFLYKNGIEEIYEFPGTAGIENSQTSLVSNIAELKRFYQKRNRPCA